MSIHLLVFFGYHYLIMARFISLSTQYECNSTTSRRKKLHNCSSSMTQKNRRSDEGEITIIICLISKEQHTTTPQQINVSLLSSQPTSGRASTYRRTNFNSIYTSIQIEHPNQVVVVVLWGYSLQWLKSLFVEASEKLISIVSVSNVQFYIMNIHRNHPLSSSVPGLGYT